MVQDSKQKPPTRGGLSSLYANLLDPLSAAGPASVSISRAPVVFKQNEDLGERVQEEDLKKQQAAAALRFQPLKNRPQLSTPKGKARTPFSKAGFSKPLNVTDALSTNSVASVGAPRPAAKSTLADWATADDVNGFYGEEKRQRGGRKRRKKNKEDEIVPQDWDDIYDPSRPNSYEEYKNSEEKIREVRDWKNRLYAHRTKQKRRDTTESDEESSRGSVDSKPVPPSSYSFAPPPDFSQGVQNRSQPNVEVLDDKSGEDAYARRLRLSGLQPQIDEPSRGFVSGPNYPAPPIPPPAPPVDEPPPPPPPPQEPPAMISRAPVRYSLPLAPSEIPATEAELVETLRQEQANEEGASEQESTDTPRSLRPGQKGFAERLMSKYGWTKGSGLGAEESGIVNPLRVKVEKQKKKFDAEGSGFAAPGGRGTIIGGKRKDQGKVDAQQSKFGVMSEVIVLQGMVDGMDLDEEIAGDGDGGLMQEIGEECGEKYGRVERVFIDRQTPGPAQVFVKFTSQLSALRAVNALEGRIFNGNTIKARYFDSEKFEKGIYG